MIKGGDETKVRHKDLKKKIKAHLEARHGRDGYSLIDVIKAKLKGKDIQEKKSWYRI